MISSYSFDDLIEITRRVVHEFDAAEQRPWSVEATMIELMKQVGDLARRIMTTEGYYLPDREHDPAYETKAEDIADELADVLYCIIRLADYYHVDLEEAHLQARRKEMRYLGKDATF
jgi:NTP pyrophosphatase (non-canonical NTP hydrolase)